MFYACTYFVIPYEHNSSFTKKETFKYKNTKKLIIPVYTFRNNAYLCAILRIIIQKHEEKSESVRRH